MKENYDIVVVSFSDIRFDGRTQNLIDALVCLGKKIIVFSVSNDAKTEDKYKHIRIEVPQNRRVFIRWISFISSIKNHLSKIDYKIYWACDLYSLVRVKATKKQVISTYGLSRKLIYDSREIYSALSTLHHSPFRQKIISFIEKYYIKYVNTLITSGKLDSEYLKNKYKLSIPIKEIYNYPKKRAYICADIREIFNISEEKIILLYQGVILDGRGLKPIINAIKDVGKYVLLICGEGEYKRKLIEYIDKNNIKCRVIFAGNIDYANLHKYTCCADIGLCNIEALSLSYRFANPNKLYEYILADVPILATNLPILSEIVNKYKIGKIISEKNEKDEILVALNEIILNKNQYKANICAIKNDFTYENQYDLISEIIKN